MCDLDGNPYATSLKEGDVVLVDGDFTCLTPWTSHKVLADEGGDLYIICDQGEHYLVNNENPKEYIGMYKV